MDENNKLKRFYESVFSEIKKLAKEKNFSKAFERIDEELDCPYLPEHYEKELRGLKKDVRIWQYEECAQKIAAFSPTRLVQFVLSDPVKNYDAFIFLIDKYSQKLISRDWEQILSIFNRDDLENSLKFLFLIALLEIKSLNKKNFFYYNCSTKKSFTLTMSPDLFLAHEQFTNIVFNDLNETFLKEPSKLNLSEHLVDLLTTYFFPDLIPYPQDKLGKEITKYVNHSFHENPDYSSVDSQALKLINLTLKSNSDID